MGIRIQAAHEASISASRVDSKSLVKAIRRPVGPALTCCLAETHAERYIGAAALEMTPDDLRDIDSTASKITVQGARYPEALEQMTGR